MHVFVGVCVCPLVCVSISVCMFVCTYLRLTVYASNSFCVRVCVCVFVFPFEFTPRCEILIIFGFKFFFHMDYLCLLLLSSVFFASFFILFCTRQRASFLPQSWNLLQAVLVFSFLHFFLLFVDHQFLKPSRRRRREKIRSVYHIRQAF